MKTIEIPKALTDTKTLSNGVRIPSLAYGTWQTPSEITAECVKMAIEAGYRHIDGACAYENEEGIGEAIRLSGIDRKELFITSKLWITDRKYEDVIKAVDTSLKKIGTDYLDLYLIHWPCVEACTSDWERINSETWRAFEDLYSAGKIRAIGVSNFERKHLEALEKTAKIYPMVNQIEFHPGYTQMDNVLYSQQKGMVVEAWSPVGSGTIIKNKSLEQIAKRYNKSVPQLCIRFAIQCGIIPLPKSTNKEHIYDNANVFDFEISSEDMEAIHSLPNIGCFTMMNNGEILELFPENAPADKLLGLC